MPPRSRKRRRRSGADGRSSNYSDKLIESNVLRILEQQRAERSAASERNGTESRRQQQLGQIPGYYYDSSSNRYYKCNDAGPPQNRQLRRSSGLFSHPESPPMPAMLTEAMGPIYSTERTRGECLMETLHQREIMGIWSRRAFLRGRGASAAGSAGSVQRRLDKCHSRRCAFIPLSSVRDHHEGALSAASNLVEPFQIRWATESLARQRRCKALDCHERLPLLLAAFGDSAPSSSSSVVSCYLFRLERYENPRNASLTSDSIIVCRSVLKLDDSQRWRRLHPQKHRHGPEWLQDDSRQESVHFQCGASFFAFARPSLDSFLACAKAHSSRHSYPKNCSHHRHLPCGTNDASHSCGGGGAFVAIGYQGSAGICGSVAIFYVPSHKQQRMRLASQLADAAPNNEPSEGSNVLHEAPLDPVYVAYAGARQEHRQQHRQRFRNKNATLRAIAFQEMDARVISRAVFYPHSGKRSAHELGSSDTQRSCGRDGTGAVLILGGDKYAPLRAHYLYWRENGDSSSNAHAKGECRDQGGEDYCGQETNDQGGGGGRRGSLCRGLLCRQEILVRQLPSDIFSIAFLPLGAWSALHRALNSTYSIDRSRYCQQQQQQQQHRHHHQYKQRGKRHSSNDLCEASDGQYEANMEGSPKGKSSGASKDMDSDEARSSDDWRPALLLGSRNGRIYYYFNGLLKLIGVVDLFSTSNNTNGDAKDRRLLKSTTIHRRQQLAPVVRIEPLLRHDSHAVITTGHGASYLTAVVDLLPAILIGTSCDSHTTLSTQELLIAPISIGIPSDTPDGVSVDFKSSALSDLKKLNVDVPSWPDSNSNAQLNGPPTAFELRVFSARTSQELSCTKIHEASRQSLLPLPRATLLPPTLSPHPQSKIAEAHFSFPENRKKGTHDWLHGRTWWYLQERSEESTDRDGSRTTDHVAHFSYLESPAPASWA